MCLLTDLFSVLCCSLWGQHGRGCASLSVGYSQLLSKYLTDISIQIIFVGEVKFEGKKKKCHEDKQLKSGTQNSEPTLSYMLVSEGELYIFIYVLIMKWSHLESNLCQLRLSILVLAVSEFAARSFVQILPSFLKTLSSPEGAEAVYRGIQRFPLATTC